MLMVYASNWKKNYKWKSYTHTEILDSRSAKEIKFHKTVAVC